MKDILTAPFVEEMKKITANMYRQGWDERNGGNISYMLDEDKVAEYLDVNKVLRTIPTGFDATELIGKYFIVTGTGKYFKNVEVDPETNLGIIRIAKDGTQNLPFLQTSGECSHWSGTDPPISPLMYCVRWLLFYSGGDIVIM